MKNLAKELHKLEVVEGITLKVDKIDIIVKYLKEHDKSKLLDACVLLFLTLINLDSIFKIV